MRSLGRLPVGLGSSNKIPWHTNQRLSLRFTRSKRPYSSSSLLLRLPFELSRYSNKHQHAEKLSKTHHTHTHTHKQTRGLPGSLHLSFRLLLCQGILFEKPTHQCEHLPKRSHWAVPRPSDKVLGVLKGARSGQNARPREQTWRFRADCGALHEFLVRLILC